MKRRMAAVLVSLALLLAVRTAHGASFLDRPWGTPEAGLSARSRAMGGTGVALANGSYSLVDNPATLILATGSRAQVASGLTRASENRFVPLFDTFDSFVDEGAIAINDHSYASLSGGVTWDPRRWRGVVLAAGILDRLDPRYDYYDERRTTATTDVIVSERFIRTRGVLRSASVGAALPLKAGAGVGLALHRWFGTVEDRDALVPRAPGVSGKVTALSRRITGHSFSLGAAWRANERLDVGLSYETAPRLHDDFIRWQDDSIVSAPQSNVEARLPSRLAFGAAYRPRNAFRTTFALDAVYTSWSKLRDPLLPGAVFLDTWDVHFGLEHVYYNALPGRIGFRYARSYALREADRATFTFGLGERVGRVAFDLSGEVGKRISRQEPLWPRDEQGPAVGTGRDRVEDTVLRVFLGAELGF
jgi:hypothetical protein